MYLMHVSNWEGGGGGGGGGGVFALTRERTVERQQEMS